MNRLSCVVCPLSCALALAFAGCSEKSIEKVDRRPLVRVGAVTNGVTFADALAVQGMVRAKYTASVAARVPGTIDAVLVEEGAVVKKGAALFRIDRVNLANAVRAAKDDLAMAKAKLAQAVATDAKAKLDVERLARLLKDGAVTKDMFEKSDVAAKSYAAALDAAKATVTKAETGLAVAEKNFADSEVRAPFDGIVTKKFKNAGDFCGAGMKVFEMENTSAYEICVSLNAAHYARVVVGETELEVNNRIIELSNNRIAYKSPTVSPLTRTFEVRADVTKTDSLAAGMLVDCRIVFARRKGQALPAAAVARRGGGDCVFAVKEGKVTRITVEAGLEADGWREIVSPVLTDDAKIILEGMLLVNEGDEVRTEDVSL